MSERTSLPACEDGPKCEQTCETDLGRRDFLFAAGASLVALALPGTEVKASAKVAQYPRKKLAKLSEIQEGKPIEFQYPWEHPNCASVLLKLSQSGGGRHRPTRTSSRSTTCAHTWGWKVPASKFHADPGIAGPCAGHWTTFDLTRHGMVISGHSSEGLPQVMLELDGDDIYVATLARAWVLAKNPRSGERSYGFRPRPSTAIPVATLARAWVCRTTLWRA